MNISSVIFGLVGLAVSSVASAATVPSATSATLVPNAASVLVAQTGEVILTFVSKSAAYSSNLFLNGTNTSLLNSATAQAGSQYSLGSFQAGTQLSFNIFVKDTQTRYTMGDASLNPDGVIHAAYKETGGQVITIGFEDLFGGGDKDYNDLIFSLNNVVVASAVPEPQTYALLGLGLGILVMVKRRQS